MDLTALDTLSADLKRLKGVKSPSQPAFVVQARDIDSRLHDLIASSCGNTFLANELGRLKTLFRAFRDVAWVAFKELRVGLILGLILAVIGFGRAELLGVGSDIGLAVSFTILVICVWSATIAAVLPLVLRRLGVDPAVVSAPLITTLVDGTGLIIYFEIAKLVLRV